MDIMCVGKGIIGGYMLFVVMLISEKIFNVFLVYLDENKMFFYGYMYMGN